jgi:hypothetical protein
VARDIKANPGLAGVLTLTGNTTLGAEAAIRQALRGYMTAGD